MRNLKKEQFNGQKFMARKRDIPFLLTFEQWCEIWEDSGKYEMRGRKLGQYCMSRVKDTGPYSIDNVFIQLHADNVKEAKPNYSPNKGRVFSDEWKRKIGEASSKHKHTPETKKKISESALKRPPVTDETRKKLSLAAKNRGIL